MTRALLAIGFLIAAMLLVAIVERGAEQKAVPPPVAHANGERNGNRISPSAVLPLSHPLCQGKDQYVAHFGGPTPAITHCVNVDFRGK